MDPSRVVVPGVERLQQLTGESGGERVERVGNGVVGVMGSLLEGAEYTSVSRTSLRPRMTGKEGRSSCVLSR
ncbi:MAG: hypothetical protein AUJ01_02990 [Acidobacteria bacterium 13_1_40CM_3_65_5]|nr:MAG: hypothetical protein AUJ01_02990 [Acidobacteria bacterium 13_1_40CM_3_65_5]OLE79644.1 MAG: hypothetical protein AUF76_16150 [Acidobacteria bacterium 13_1_20CM_2_65_9]